MGSLFDSVERIVKRQMVLFFVVDTSSSMEGRKIGTVNTAIKQVLPELRDIGGADVDLKIACLKFSTGCEWMHPAPVDVETFVWNQIGADGETDLGEACRELSVKMSRKEFLTAPSASVAPAIFLMSDGPPTDDYDSGLAALKENNWFKHAIKVAVAIGDDADRDALAKFTGNPEAVVTVHTPEALRKWIRFITVTSTMIGSTSHLAPDAIAQPGSKQQDMIDQIQTQQAEPDFLKFKTAKTKSTRRHDMSESELLDVKEIVKRQMVLFFVVDTSGSMEGRKIGTVNTAIKQVVPELRDIGGADVDLKIACLKFSTGCEWMHPAPVDVETFVWNQIGAEGVTDLGEACKELSVKMSRKAFLTAPSASVAPAIFLMSDGQPTDDYDSGLAALKENNWFKHAIKVAVAIGDDADRDALAKFTGSSEAVVTVHTPEALRKWIRFLTVTSTMIGRTSHLTPTGQPVSKQQDVIGQIQEQKDADPNQSTAADDW
jgi:uncharacterized protein YegL